MVFIKVKVAEWPPFWKKLSFGRPYVPFVKSTATFENIY